LEENFDANGEVYTRTFKVSRSTFKKVDFIEKKLMQARTQLQFEMTAQSERSFPGSKLNNTPRKN